MTEPRVTILDSGLRVATVDMPGLETAAVGAWVDAGARDERRELNGISHLLEHMAFKGTERRNALAIAEEIESVGGHLNAYTSREQTAFIARVLKEHVPLAVDLLGDILQHTVMPAEELEREREVVMQEIAQCHDTPDDVVFDLFQETAYPDQPIGRSILGTVDSVAGFTRDDVFGYMKDHYGAGGMVAVAAGRIDHDDFVELNRHAFDALPRHDGHPVAPAEYTGGDTRREQNLEQVHLVMGFNGVAYDDPSFYAMQVLSTAFGGGMSSRLFQEVREKRGLAYSVYSFTASYVDGGLFGIYAGAGESHVDQLVPVICDEVIKVAQHVNDDEIDRARAQLKASLLMSMESPSSRCEQLGRQMLIFGRPIPASEIIDKIDEVDGAAIEIAARNLVAGGAPTVTALGPIGRVEAYEKIAERFG